MSGSTPETGGYVDPNFANPQGPHDAHIIIYGYVPSFALCILAIILFTLSAVLHLVEALRHRTYYFLPLTFACLLETLGYVFRALSARQDPYNIIDFIVQYFCIVTAPVFISASIYVCLSRLITWADRHGFSAPHRGSEKKRGLRRWLHPKGILWGFVTCDVISTVIQVAGAALIGSKESKHTSATVPNNILLAGLAFQTFAFTIFLVLLATFRFSLARARNNNMHDVARTKDAFLVALAVASLLIYLRTIFRLAETSQGVFGYLSRHEGFFGGLEFAPVVVAVGVLAGWHPGRWIPGRVVESGGVEETKG